MKATNNPLFPTLQELFENLNLLRGLLLVLEKRFDNYRKQVINDNVDLSYLFSASSLVIRKLTEFPKDGWAKHYPTGRFIASGQKYLEALNQLIERESAWTVSQGYERFESFLLDIVTIFLVNNNKFAKEEEKKSKLKELKTKYKSKKPQINNYDLWRSVLKVYYKDKKIVLENILEWAPDFKDAIENNNRNIDLLKWYSVVKDVRDAATHSNLIIKNGILQKILQSQEKKAILEEYFPGKHSSIGYELTLSKKTDYNLKIFAEFALEIFNNLSIKANYDYNIEL